LPPRHSCVQAQVGDDVDPDLDFITDDDDLAVLFTGADGKPFWVFGNVEEVAVVRGAVDKSRALGGNSAKYLLDLDKDPRPLKGVYVNDHKVHLNLLISGAFDLVLSG